MPIIKDRKKYAKTMTALTGVFAMVVAPTALYFTIDEGVSGADNITLSDAAAKEDRAYIEQRMEDLRGLNNNVVNLTAQQGTLYRQDRTGGNDAYAENSQAIYDTNKQIETIKQDIFENIYSNRSLSESDLQSIMHQYRLEFKEDVPLRGEIQEDFARHIRSCQVEYNMDIGFVEPTEYNAEKIERCASDIEEYNETPHWGGFTAVTSSLIALFMFVMANGDMHRDFLNRHDRLTRRKQDAKKNKTKPN